ncbi:hypothetical protein P4606_19860 [Priestia aryabhattai]|nr:hypothetical protein [Priestia aryabhattai]
MNKQLEPIKQTKLLENNGLDERDKTLMRGVIAISNGKNKK